jgi:hypothetical protein
MEKTKMRKVIVSCLVCLFELFNVSALNAQCPREEIIDHIYDSTACAGLNQMDLGPHRIYKWEHKQILWTASAASEAFPEGEGTCFISWTCNLTWSDYYRWPKFYAL